MPAIMSSFMGNNYVVTFWGIYLRDIGVPLYNMFKDLLYTLKATRTGLKWGKWMQMKTLRTKSVWLHYVCHKILENKKKHDSPYVKHYSVLF